MAVVRRFALWLLVLHGAEAAAQGLGGQEEEALLQVYGDEEMISIATGSRQPIAKAPAVATVITAEDIKAIGATDLDEILETVPGLHVARSFLGYNPIYTFRGIYSDFNPQVLMLINGIPITNLFQGDRNIIWGGMPVQAISRIEVIRGPGSALYGADAFAGVINIITKSKDDIKGTEAGFRAGSFDTYDGWLLHGDTWAGFDVAAMFEFRDSNGQRQTIDADAQTAFDQALDTNASLAPGPVNLQRENFDARLDLSRGHWRFRGGLQRRRDAGIGTGLAQALDSNSRFASDRWNADLTYHNPEFARDWDVTAQATYLDTSQEIERDAVLFPPGATLPIGADGNINPVAPVGLVNFPQGLIGNPEVFERHARAGVSAFYTGFERHLLRLGAGFNYSNLYKVRETKNFGPGVTPGILTDVSNTPFVFLRTGDRENYYIFGQDEWKFATDWELTVGVRYDHYSDFGDTVNPRAALVWETRHDLTSKLMYGRAFRAPSFAETRNINNPVQLGNPSLDPEKMQTLELAFDYHPTHRLRLGLGFFGYQWDDIIRFVPETEGARAQNSGEQVGYGLELEADWRLTDTLRLLGNYAYQQSRDRTTDKDAGNAPRHQVYLRGEWEFVTNWHFSPQLNAVMDRRRVAGDDRSDIDDYVLVDLTIRRKYFKNHWEMGFSVRNLFDVDAREPSPPRLPAALIPNDLPLAGRSFFGEIRFNF